MQMARAKIIKYLPTLYQNEKNNFKIFEGAQIQIRILLKEIKERVRG